MKKDIRLGDTIARVTKLLGIPHCEKCEKRRLILNEIGRLGIKRTMGKLMALESKNTQRLDELIKELDNCCDENGK